MGNALCFTSEMFKRPLHNTGHRGDCLRLVYALCYEERIDKLVNAQVGFSNKAAQLVSLSCASQAYGGKGGHEVLLTYSWWFTSSAQEGVCYPRADVINPVSKGRDKSSPYRLANNASSTFWTVSSISSSSRASEMKHASNWDGGR